MGSKRAPVRRAAEVEIRPVFEAEDFGEELTPELREQEERLRAEIERPGSSGERPACPERDPRWLTAAHARHRGGLADRVRPADRRPRADRARRRARRGARPGRARRRARAVARVGRPRQPGRLAHGHRQAPRRSTACAATSCCERKSEEIARELDCLQAAATDLAAALDDDVGDDVLRPRCSSRVTRRSPRRRGSR